MGCDCCLAAAEASKPGRSDGGAADDATRPLRRIRADPSSTHVLTATAHHSAGPRSLAAVEAAKVDGRKGGAAAAQLAQAPTDVVS